MSCNSAKNFQDYFNVADEIYPAPDRLGWQPKLDDIDLQAKIGARAAACELGLPWPPYLPAAEEYALDHPEVRT